jgi:spore maturation protein CgeB
VFCEFSGNLIEDLKYLLENPEERARVAEHGRAYVQNRHNAAVVAERTVQVYRSIT